MAVHVSNEGSLSGGPSRATLYSWIVFALSFGLLISDYMARQVLNAVFPLLKAEWDLSDAQLGLLTGIVAIMVGLLTFPLSLAADKWGRVRSLALMAILWSLATLLCAVARSFEEMLLGRALVGVGEAAYGSVGIAVVISVFPQRLRATLAAAFMAGGLFGQVLGVAAGAEIAADYGWRVAFMVIGVFGLALGVLYPIIVREKRIAALATETPQQPADTPDTPDQKTGSPSLRSLFSSRSVRLAYMGSGLELFATASLAAWLPSYLNRYYDLPVDSAGRVAAVLLLVCGTGMIMCGTLSDRLARNRPENKIALAMTYCLTAAVCLTVAMQLPFGTGQLVILGAALFFVGGTNGPSGAMVANLTPLALHGSAFATLTLANNLFGLAPGPIITGRIADSIGLHGAFMLLPVTCVAAALCFGAMRRSYLADLGPDAHLLSSRKS
ncbi:MAG: MFS transporter [Sphingomonadaceae bacterium]